MLYEFRQEARVEVNPKDFNLALLSVFPRCTHNSLPMMIPTQVASRHVPTLAATFNNPNP